MGRYNTYNIINDKITLQTSWCNVIDVSYLNANPPILSETSKPPLDIFSYILTYMIHTWLKFTLNMEKSIKQNLSKFHYHKLNITCSIDRLIKGTIAFNFHTNARI